MATIIFVTGNKNKVREVETFLKTFGIDITDVNLDIDEVQADDIEYIARRAAEDSYRFLKKALIVEDSGLYINALNGFPGPYSSYVYRTLGVNGILKLMSNVEKRDAIFKAAIAYADEKIVKVFVGEIRGKISFEPRGRGWGFDPIFIPDGSSKTFGEMDVNEKNIFSHRGKALLEFAKWFTAIHS
ncbi:MAG: XTP/dITP diphosphatase [Thermoprotei archaeon]